MAGILGFRAVGYREVTGRFAKRSEVLEDRRRGAMRRAGQIGVQALRRNAPSKTGVFAAGFFARSYDRGYTSTVRIYSGGEHAFLLDWIRFGTKPHKIPRGGSAEQLAKGYPLRFYWEKGPRGPGVYAFWSVNHPGTKPNPFIEEAMAEAEPEILAELRAVAASVARL